MEPAGSCIDFFSAMSTKYYLETSGKLHFWGVITKLPKMPSASKTNAIVNSLSAIESDISLLLTFSFNIPIFLIVSIA
jgi:hypothetical protein